MERIFARAYLLKEDVMQRLLKVVGNTRSTLNSNKGQGFVELIVTIAIVFVIAAFVGVPQLRNFAGNVFTGLNDFYTSIKTKLFPTT